MNALHQAYGYHQHDPACRDRLEKLVGKAGLFLNDDIRIPVCANMPSSIHWDHVTIVTDIEGHVFFMNEPYGAPADHEVELNASGMPWFRVPSRYAPYGGGTTTYLIAVPWLRDALDAVRWNLGLPPDALHPPL